MFANRAILNACCLLFFCGWSAWGFAQTPCSGGMAGDYPCNQVALQARMTMAEMTANKTNDIWGWTSPSSSKEYAIVGLNNGTAFVDISNPTSPVLLGKIATASSNSSWRDVKVKANHAYIVSEASAHGIQVFDLNALDTVTTPPVTFSANNTITIPGTGRAHNIVAHEHSDYIYPVGSSNCFGGLMYYDASDPINLSFTDCYSDANYTHDAVCFIYNGPDTEHTGKEICIGFNDNIFVIVDITEKDNPEELSSTTYPGNHYAHQGWTTDDQRYLFLDDELDESNFNHNTKTYVFNLTDLDNPTLHMVYQSSFAAIDHNQYVRGNYLYQANYRAGLRILDISDIDNTNINEVAYFDVYPSDDAVGFNGVWSVYPFFESGNLVLSGIKDVNDNPSGGLFVVNANLPHCVMKAGGTGVAQICQGEAVSYSIDLTAFSGFNETISLSIPNLPTGVEADFSPNPVAADGFTTLTLSKTESFIGGNHYLRVVGDAPTGPDQSIAVSVMVDPLPAFPLLLAPEEGEILFDDTPVLNWQADADSDFYTITIASDPGMINLVQTATNLTSATYTTSPLTIGESFYWRVTGHNDCGDRQSNVQLFSVKNSQLPVELLQFTAHPQNKAIQLRWATASETNNAGFALERLTAGEQTDFTPIDWQGGKNPNGALYEYLDTEISTGGTFLYRLRQVDLDGRETLSKIISAQLPRASALQVFPNPAQEWLQVDLGQLDLSTAQLSIHDVAGRLQQVYPLQADADQQTRLHIADFPKGVYILQFTNTKRKISLRFIKT
ncbi:MAG: choice-of-anchor B family protein [Bacteroidota bacterium]